MRQPWTALLFLVLPAFLMAQSTPSPATAADPPAGYWPAAKSQPLISATESVRLAADLSGLSQGERLAVDTLFEVGRIFQDLYEEQRHPDALRSRAALERADAEAGSPVWSRNLLTVYRLNQGPVATTLENAREAFVPVGLPPPGANVYPPDATKVEIERFLEAHPGDRAAVLDPRTVVRRTTRSNLERDIARLAAHPVLDALHPGLARGLAARLAAPDDRTFYAVPYSVAYADDLVRAHARLNDAAVLIDPDDAEFARFLRNRSRDLLSDDYESGDAAWVTGRFKRLNAQIGSYETYDDTLFGVKTFFGLSVLLTRDAETRTLRAAMRGLQALEDALPYAQHKRIREDIPVGVYDVVADFGQARGGNTATILPNEAYLASRYGRTILLRANIMRNAAIFEAGARTWRAAVAPAHALELVANGGFYRTLWHEVGHYLGVDRTREGRDLDSALQDSSSLLEEMKADLVSLFVGKALHDEGYYSADQLRALYASGVQRVLQSNRPRREQPYNTMQLMQWNFFLENGVLSIDPAAPEVQIHYERYHEAVARLLAKVLEVQHQGDRAGAERFVEQYSRWDEAVHGAVAGRIRAVQRARFRLFTYAALGE